MIEREFERLKAIVDLLMATAYADGNLAGMERRRVHEILEVVVEDDDARRRLGAHVERFAPENFDLEAACGVLGPQSPGAARMLLSLLAQVVDADGVKKADESAFVRQVAERIGATPETYAELVAEVLALEPLISVD